MSKTKMTVTEFFAANPSINLYELAKKEKDDNASRPWVVLAFRRSARNGGFAIVAGYNRWTGESINWIVAHFDNANYDTSNAVELGAE